MSVTLHALHAHYTSNGITACCIHYTYNTLHMTMFFFTGRRQHSVQSLPSQRAQKQDGEEYIRRGQQTRRNLKESVRLQSGQNKRILACNPGNNNANPAMPNRWPLKRQPNQMSEQSHTAGKQVPREPTNPCQPDGENNSAATYPMANKHRQSITYDVQIQCLEQPLMMCMQKTLSGRSTLEATASRMSRMVLHHRSTTSGVS